MKQILWTLLPGVMIAAPALAQGRLPDSAIRQLWEDAEPPRSELSQGRPELPMGRRAAVTAALPQRAARAVGPRLESRPGFEYDVRFTNPACSLVRYPRQVPSRDPRGTQLSAKPQGAYCRSGDPIGREITPRPKDKLLQWIGDPTTREIFFTYLSFRERDVVHALCSALSRGVRLTFFIDKGVPGDDGSPAAPDVASANEVVRCARTPGQVRFELRGHEGGIDFSHNKIMLINPGEVNPRDAAPRETRIVFSSANLTSGLTTHHENWNFIKTDTHSHFARTHVCVMQAMIGHTRSAQDYSSFLNRCVAEIRAPEEVDVRAFFTPASGDRAADELVDGIRRSREIWMAAHRFSFNEMLDALRGRLGRAPRPDIRLIADDDLHWTGLGDRQGVPADDEREITRIPNMPFEASAVAGLMAESQRRGGGMETRYVETNQLEFQLQHNKFLIFDSDSVFTGAGNLTGAAFRSNLENYYVVSIPSIVAKYREQHQRMWNTLSSLKDPARTPGPARPFLPAANHRL
jgi:phosphatidylserine/phosphatidylglycerophosphate/cardiolipin synthase-like enzyme